MPMNLMRLEPGYASIVSKHPKVEHRAVAGQMGTLGTGNHFIEVCLDEEQRVWVMLHSGSRGPGNKIGTYFIDKAKREMENRQLMMQSALVSMGQSMNWDLSEQVYSAPTAVNCHHNYVERENHFGENVLVTRKGAVRARVGDLGIIPGSMGARSYIVRGKGNPESFHSCSHGAGRRMSRTAAKKMFSLEMHAAAMHGVEARLDADVIDETPMAYKSIDDVMAAQADLVEVVHTLKQVLCVKG